MLSSWSTKKVLITARTYPVPAHQGIEVSCTAGVSDSGEWIRIYPVPYRFLTPDQRFTKYQWIEAEVTRPSNDPRPESFRLRMDSIRIGSTVGTADNWRQRKELIYPLKRPSLCGIAQARRDGGPTLGLFQPATIKRLIITQAKPPGWTPDQQAILGQQLLGLEAGPKTPLEKIPLEFRYQFTCAEPGCRGHRMMCTDWEMGESYRRWRVEYGDKWEAAFRQRYEEEMINRYDTHFYVGNIHQHQDNWLIVGLFYPPRSAMGDLFDAR